jgi:hypothetical protein
MDIPNAGIQVILLAPLSGYRVNKLDGTYLLHGAESFLGI